MNADQIAAVIGYLEQFVTPARRDKIEAILADRTRHITVVAEDFHDVHNASAILRTCESFGVQDVHVVENFNTFKARRGAASGSTKWVTIHHYGAEQRDSRDSTQQCLDKLRAQGYLVAATSPYKDGIPPEAVPIDQKLAVWFGSERYGVSERALQEADLILKIPMVGFMESLNVSVSVALCLYVLTRRLRQMDVDWQLSDREKHLLRLLWIRQSAQHGEQLEQHFLAQQGW